MLGRDITVAGLLDEGYEAVFLASGGWDSRLARGAEKAVESPLPGGLLLLDLLRSGKDGHEDVTCGTDVVVVGGAELAGETLAQARALGAGSVTFIFRDLPDESTVGALVDAGAQVVTGAVIKLTGEGDALTAVDVLNPASGEIAQIPAQTIVFSSGRFPELIFSRSAGISGDNAQPWTAVPPYKAPAQFGEVGLFAKGDALTDFSGAIKAIAAGRRAAAAIQMMIYDIPLDLRADVLKPDATIQNVDHVEAVAPSQRRIMPLADNRDLAQLKELEKGFDTATATAEAERCLRCGLICYQHSNNQRSPRGIRDAINA
jgi:hypothetical protein